MPKIMTIFAHPADTITNCGGTLALHANRGDEMVALILSHGERIHANKYAEEWREANPDADIAAAGLDDVVGTKLAAMDEFVSQGYNGLFARKLVESFNGEAGRTAGVNFAEAYIRLRRETHTHLPLTDAAQNEDPLTRHTSYSSINLREQYPIDS